MRLPLAAKTQQDRCLFTALNVPRELVNLSELAQESLRH